VLLIKLIEKLHLWVKCEHQLHSKQKQLPFAENSCLPGGAQSGLYPTGTLTMDLIHTVPNQRSPMEEKLPCT
jgi:hypothetical protein